MRDPGATFTSSTYCTACGTRRWGRSPGRSEMTAGAAEAWRPRQGGRWPGQAKGPRVWGGEARLLPGWALVGAVGAGAQAGLLVQL
jgi:hypothetical protein